MVKLGQKEKKFKGKKKVSNVLEKKAKGLKLNKVDRKRVVKIGIKNAQRAELKQSVKSELVKFESGQPQNDDDTRDSLCSESSFGSQPTKSQPKKRVSFAGNLERTKVFDKNVKDVEAKMSEASPGKGILRAKAKAKKDKDAAAKLKKNSVKSEETKSKPVEEAVVSNKENETLVPKKKAKIQVTKKVKEQLLTMDKKERRNFLRELKAQKNPLSDKIMEAKLLWEKIRSSKTPKVEKDDNISQLVAVVKGNAAKLIYAHDTCRVIECLIGLKRPGITSNLFAELTPEIVRMTKSKYARFFVSRMLKLGTKQQRDIIINAFSGHAVSLMRITHAAEVLETAYNEFADQKQRFNIVSEFYGREFVMFRSDEPRTLTEIINEEPAKKKLILQHMEEYLQGWVEKTTIRHTLTHKLLLDFLGHCDKDQFTNMIDSLKDKIPEIVHTPEGSIVAMKCIWNSSAKDRKLMVKNFKELSVKAAMEHFGHRVLQALFDSVDDTVLVNKYVISELGNEIAKLIHDPWGEKVIHYIVHPRDGRGMSEREIIRLKEGDTNPTSKKAKKDRYAELYAGITESLYPYLAANMEELVFEHKKFKFITACLETTSQYDLFDRKVPTEMRQRCNQAIIDLAAQEFIPMDSERFHFIEHPSGHFLMMGVLRCDKDLPEDERLSNMMVESMESQEYGSWIACNKGCHVLLKMIQSGSPVVKQRIREAVNMKQLKEYTFKGAMLLADELSKK